jgi:hypothetical protein
MDSTKYIGMDLHHEAISIAVLNGSGKRIMESVRSRHPDSGWRDGYGPFTNLLK